MNIQLTNLLNEELISKREELTNLNNRQITLIKEIIILQTIQQPNITIIDLTGFKLAEACTKILADNKIIFTAKILRDVLKLSGYDLTIHNNPLAGIHGVLKRFAQQNKINYCIGNNDTYYWID